MTAQVPTAAKIKAIERELTLRLNLYPKRVARHEMSQHEADYQIEVMEAILADYKALLRHESRTE